MGKNKLPRKRKGQKKKPSKHVQGYKIDDKMYMDDSGRVIRNKDYIPYFPSVAIVVKIIMCVRLMSAIWMHITDCDEVYNFWEPTYHLMYGKGFQTWEYGPQHALRSYAYLMFHASQGFFFKMTSPSPHSIFFFLRAVLSIGCTVCETYFYNCVCQEFGVNVARILLVLLLSSTGMFIGCVSFLPSTFCMYMTLLSYGAWFESRYKLAIFCTALSSILSWPFAALLGLPIAIDMLRRPEERVRFIKWSIISAVIIMVPQIEIDSRYYGRLVWTTWNIIRYNVFTSHGPDIYGTDPWHFYFKNLFLNFNITFILALLTPVLLVLSRILIPKRHNSIIGRPFAITLGGFYLWFIVFLWQAHKEERFMFPAYPLICLCAAVSLDTIQLLVFRFSSQVKRAKSHYVKDTNKVLTVLLPIIAILGASRTLALYKAYHAPINVYMQLPNVDNNFAPWHNSSVMLCMGKEWHRYPSSFFLPQGWDVAFIKSEFDGQLPGKYDDRPGSESIYKPDLNDLNLEEPSHYVDINRCDVLIDLATKSTTPKEPNYSKHNNWTVFLTEPFLDAINTEQHVRTFYIPIFWELNANYIPYNVLIRRNMKKKKRSRPQGVPVFKGMSSGA